jgi:hypothetical protein
MKNVTLVAALATLCSTMSLSGQNKKISFGINAGPNYSFSYGNDASELYNPWINVSAGVNVQYQLNNIFSVLSGVSYEVKSQRQNFTLTDKMGVEMGEINMAHRFSYVTVPLLLRATFGKNFKVFANAGAFVGCLTNARQVAPPGTYSDALDQNITGAYRRFDAGVASGVGVIIPVTQRLQVSGEVRNSFGLYNRQSSLATGYNKSNSTALLLGLAYAL